MGTIPLDILLYIIDLLAVGDDEDVKSLQMLSQACKSMVPLCRKHLFSSIRLISESKSERFSDLLSKNPDIARYVRNLYYSFFHIPQAHELNTIEILKERSPLHAIQLSSRRDWDWNDFPESIRSSLVSCSSCQLLPSSASIYSTSFRRRRSQVVATSSTSSLDALNWILLKSIRSSHAVKSQHQYRYVSRKKLMASQTS